MYSNGYLYVGSHSWCGPVGEIDPNYSGSSQIALRFKWKPERIILLEVVSESRKLIAEREWIERYCRKYGIADCAIKCARSTWALKFSSNGRMLNLHSNTSESMREASLTKEVRAKVVARRFETGELNRTLSKMVKAAASKDARKRAIETQMQTGGLQRRLSRLNSKEAKAKIDYVSSHRKASETKKKVRTEGYGKHHFVCVYKDGEIVAEGRVAGCCKILGNCNWSAYANRKIREGHTEIEHHGYLFILRIQSK